MLHLTAERTLESYTQFIEGIQDSLSSVSMSGAFTLLLVDIDNFQKVNAAYGYPTGDTMVEHFTADRSKHGEMVDRVAHIGGERFALLLPRTQRPVERSLLNGAFIGKAWKPNPRHASNTSLGIDWWTNTFRRRQRSVRPRSLESAGRCHQYGQATRKKPSLMAYQLIDVRWMHRAEIGARRTTNALTPLRDLSNRSVSTKD